MYILGGIAYAGTPQQNIRIRSVKPLADMMMLITFSSGETRLFDASRLLMQPVFAPLADEQVFRNAQVEHGVVTWADGEIDIAPETMYRDSYEYECMAQ